MASRGETTLRGPRRFPWAGAVVAAVLAIVLADPAIGELARARAVLFVAGPLLLVADLANRLDPFLRAEVRRLAISTPIAPERHFRAAGRSAAHGRWLLAGLGVVAIAVGSRAQQPEAIAGLALDWLLLVVQAAAFEPCAAAAAAFFGRRFPEGSPLSGLQHTAANGLTLPEAAVHLWAPGLAVGLAALCAMPAQLALDRLLDGAGVGTGLIGFAVAGMLVPQLARPWIARAFAAGFFAAVPILAETDRALAGPPRPDPVPAWVLRLRGPALRLALVRLWRVTPVPSLRLAALLAWVVFATVGDRPPGPRLWAAALVPMLLWALPMRRLLRAGEAIARFVAPLPLPHARARALPWVIAIGPIAIGPALVWLRWSLP